MTHKKAEAERASRENSDTTLTGFELAMAASVHTYQGDLLYITLHITNAVVKCANTQVVNANVT